MTFGDNLKKLRKENNLTQEELARRVGTTKQAISRYENSMREPSIKVAKQIADALGVSVSQIAGVKKPTPKNEDELDAALIEMLKRLRPDEIPRVLDFAAGLIASRKV